jgi:hypothetical protein
MGKSIKLFPKDWEKLKNRLTNDYSPSVMMIRTKMRSVLGFVPRNHIVWRHDVGGSYPIEQVHLDFYNEPKRTMFLLKYSEYLDNSGKIDLRDS